jgi:hypothetical protein
MRARITIAPAALERMCALLRNDAGAWMSHAHIDETGALIVETRPIEQASFQEAEERVGDFLSWYFSKAFDIKCEEIL